MNTLQRFGVLLLLLCASVAIAEDAPPRQDVWNGYTRVIFQLDGRDCYLVQPRTIAPGRPWIWRARFWGHRPELDVALLERGYHLAYCDVANLYGADKAIERWNLFYGLMVTKHQLGRKVALEGMSRGGLIVYNWAARNADKVACIYADAPVCDFKSWPAGWGKGKGSPADWERCKQAYGFASDDEARAFKGNPVDNLEPLAKAGVPLLHVTGDADDIVPMEENTLVMADRYKALGGSFTLIVKPDIAHKHGLDDIAPLLQFVLKHTGQQETSERQQRGGR